MIKRIDHTILLILLISLFLITFFSQKTVLIKYGEERMLITTYQKDIISLIRRINKGFTERDIISPDKGSRLKDGLTIIIKSIK